MVKRSSKYYSACVILLGLLTGYTSVIAQQKGNDYYQIHSVPVPKDVVLEVGGLAFNEIGDLGVTTRRGELWLIREPSSKNPQFIRYAHGISGWQFLLCTKE